MLAIIKTGSKQYLVEPGKKLNIEKIDGEEGKEVLFEDVLLVANGKDVRIGTPLVEGAKVKAKIVSQDKSDKVIVFQYKPKKRYQVKKGHRQPYSRVEILEIS